MSYRILEGAIWLSECESSCALWDGNWEEASVPYGMSDFSFLLAQPLLASKGCQHANMTSLGAFSKVMPRSWGYSKLSRQPQTLSLRTCLMQGIGYRVIWIVSTGLSPEYYASVWMSFMYVTFRISFPPPLRVSLNWLSVWRPSKTFSVLEFIWPQCISIEVSDHWDFDWLPTTSVPLWLEVDLEPPPFARRQLPRIYPGLCCVFLNWFSLECYILKVSHGTM